MATPRLAAGAFALAVLLLAAVPAATAASADGHFRTPRVATGAPATLDAPEAYLRWQGDGAPTLTLEAATVHVERMGIRTRSAGDLVGVQTTPFSESADHSAATLTLAPGGDGALFALHAASNFAAGLGPADARPVSHAAVARAAPDLVCDERDLLCWDVAGATEVRTDRAEGDLAGQLRLLMRGPTLVVRDADGEATYASGRTERQEGAVRDREDAWVLVTITGATGAFAAAGDVALCAADATLRAPAVTLDDAEGRLDRGLRAYVARGERVDLAGDVLLVPGAVPPLRVAPDARDATYADAFDVEVRGDVAAVSLSAMPIHESSPAVAVGVGALLLAGASALAWAWPLVQFHATSAALPLYTRLKPPQLLDNRVRNAIFEIIRANPGISARSVHRLSDQSWGTVVYHLRQLEKHNLVVSRTVGRTRNYYENHGKYRGMEVQLACLRSERARVLARLVLTTPGIAQEELVLKSTFPQPTTSYYVRKLKSAGLVEERRDGRYARYHPIGDVARFLEIAESDAPAA